MNEKGLHLTIEALLSAVLLVSLLSISIPLERSHLNELLAVQKANDLIKLWVKEGEFSEAKIVGDFNQAFPGMRGEIIIGGKKVEVNGKYPGKCTGTTGFYWSNERGFVDLRVKVFY